MNLEKILDYLKKPPSDNYANYCARVNGNLSAREIVLFSFKYSPSLTYLDLSSSELSRETSIITSWENWRKFIDNKRKSVIYKLDLEDKNQLTLCSPFCFQSIPYNRQQWELNYEGYPGYIRYHNASVPEEYDFIDFQTLSQDIYEHLMKSNDKNVLIQKWLPTVTRLEELIGDLELQSLYITFLETVVSPTPLHYRVFKSILGYSALIQKCLPTVTRSEELIGLAETQSKFLETVLPPLPQHYLVFKSILGYSMSSKIWYQMDIFYIEAALTFNEIYQPLNANIFRGSYGLLYDLLDLDEFSKLELLIRYGLYPFPEDFLELNKNTENIKDHLQGLGGFLWRSLPRGFSEYNRMFDDESQLTPRDMNILIVLHLHRKPREQQFLTRFWRCVSNAFLTFQDFKNFFTPELIEEQTKTLNSIYLWYKGIVGADKTSQPRTLKHYCRCSLRRKLREYWKLPNGIEDLPLPSSLKSYLRLEH